MGHVSKHAPYCFRRGNMLKTVFAFSFLFIIALSILPVFGVYADTSQPDKAAKAGPQEIDLPDDGGEVQPAREWGDDAENAWDEDDSWGDPFTDEGDDATRRALGFDSDGETN